jgi:predicted RecB family nuclease
MSWAQAQGRDYAPTMRITSPIFDDFLKCATKCHLRSLGERGSGNEYAEWVRVQDESYQREAARGLQEAVPEIERVVAPPATENLKTAKWRLAVDLMAQTPEGNADSRVGESRPNEETAGVGGPRSEQLLESSLHAVERVPSEGRGKAAQFVPIRFVFRNKLTKDDRLLLAFDALVLSKVLGREVSLGKIIHGDDHATLKVKTPVLIGEVRKRLEKVAVLLSSPAPPDLVLNRHCAECEFQARCRKIAVEKDDLSLLARMSAKERKKFRSKGIFTITQLSYTFRPRRRPKRMRDKREQYHHSLKALAIREKKIHIVGSPELKIDGTPVYFDVEGLPDRDFYYLIGLRIGNGESATQHSLWADAVEDEGKIWREFLGILERIEKPVLIHYGSYETTFLKRMSERYGCPLKQSVAANVFLSAVNLLSFIYGQIYFPTYSNTLKEIAAYLSGSNSSFAMIGLQAIQLRMEWEKLHLPPTKQALIGYNHKDCELLCRLSQSTGQKTLLDASTKDKESDCVEVVRTESLAPKRERWEMFANTQYALDDFKHLVKVAYWDYQREKVFIRTSQHLNSLRAKHLKARRKRHRVNATTYFELQQCPNCGGKFLQRMKAMEQLVTDLQFSSAGVKRWVTKLVRWRYFCVYCQHVVSHQRPIAHSRHYGHGLLCWCVYLSTFSGLSMNRTCRFILEVFDIELPASKIGYYKRELSAKYSTLSQEILDSLLQSPILHIDETFVDMRGQTAYVWVFTSLDRVYYLYRPSREGSFLNEMLADFKGVLVSDFYSAYDSLGCSQQKCLVHFIRDMNEDLLGSPWDVELKSLASDFGSLLRSIILTVDQYGLKMRYLRKHKGAMTRFLERVGSAQYASEVADKYKKRFEKSGGKMFTFLDYDGVPWNNNNAEHAIKLFAKYRTRTGARFTEATLKEYLVLATVFETCEFNNVNVLQFLLSQEATLTGLLKMSGSKPRLRRRWHKEWGCEK